MRTCVGKAGQGDVEAGRRKGMSRQGHEGYSYGFDRDRREEMSRMEPN